MDLIYVFFLLSFENTTVFFEACSSILVFQLNQCSIQFAFHCCDKIFKFLSKPTQRRKDLFQFTSYSPPLSETRAEAQAGIWQNQRLRNVSYWLAPRLTLSFLTYISQAHLSSNSSTHNELCPLLNLVLFSFLFLFLF